MRRLTAHISGAVQKTGYRARIVMLSSALGLRGYAQNLPDGSVKVVAEGEEVDLERLLKALQINDALIDVEKVEAEFSPATGEYIGFGKMAGVGETDQRLDRAADLLKELIVVNKDIVTELKATREELKGEIKATREELKSEIKATRDELTGEIRSARDEITTTREVLADEIRTTRKDQGNEIKAASSDIGCVHREVKAAGETLAERIEGTREEMAGEAKDLSGTIKDDLLERLVRMEADVSLIKARIGL